MIKLLGISGSLRKASFNTALLNAALPLAPEGACFTIGTIDGIPLYNADVEKEGVPQAVQALKDQIADARASSCSRRNTTTRCPAFSRMPSTGRVRP